MPSGMFRTDEAAQKTFTQLYWDDVYAQALALTDNDEDAQSLTRRVFDDAFRRFADTPCPDRYLMHLLGDVSLAFAKGAAVPEPSAAHDIAAAPKPDSAHVYNEQDTAYWTPEGSATISVAASTDSPVASSDRCIPLTIVNTLLFLGSVGGILYLLLQLGLLPRLF